MKNILTIAALSAALSVPFAAIAKPVEFQNIPEIMNKFESADLYVKKSATLGRLPEASELGSDFPTYVSDGKGGYSLETRNVMTDSVVIASMPEPIVGEVYNQWLVPKGTWQKTYGKLPTSTEFKPFKRIKTIKAIKIDDDMLKLLGSEDGKTAIIKVSWDEQGMKVYKDGYLADYEYGIAPQEMQENYELAK
ncbi:hypothetical protein HRJ45_10915 [Vibrio coralliilyticus]|uniref:hypothetical protein n=1 Tax=Vibrio coralliilyticus TaxID=190893 RepID=UPI001561694B|nr:hypothetical protein [Vibrio coralliilyticus]NRF25322.1 hypothetical protein [Vibrio coralliilyticus]NRF79616.1 hypothetical protein [Vibrio coralliilyticus]